MLEGKVDASLGVIDADILPEIRQLQRRAGEIGKLLPLCVTIAADIQDQVADGVGGVLAVPQQVLKCPVTCNRLVLAEGREQIMKFMFRNLTYAHRLS